MAGGSSGSYEDGGGAISDINVTPLVDVMLVLLIIFIAIAPLIANHGIKAKLPSTEAGQEVESKLTLTLVCNPDREHPEDRCATGDDGVLDLALFIDGSRQPDRSAASATLDQLRAANESISVTIVADRVVPYGDMMAVLDLVKRSKIDNFTLATKRKPKTP